MTTLGTVTAMKREMCELSTRARAFSVEALLGVKRQRIEETGKNNNLICVCKENTGKKVSSCGI